MDIDKEPEADETDVEVEDFHLYLSDDDVLVEEVIEMPEKVSG